MTLRLLLPLLLLGLTACGPDYLVQREFGDQCWDSSDTLQADLEVTTVSDSQTVWICTELLADYPYQNLQLRLKVTAPDGSNTVTPLNLPAVSPEGDWLTTPERGGYPFITPVTLATEVGGTYHLNLYHYMRDALICNVQSIGLSLQAP